MQKHAIALGYLFLAAFFIHVSHQEKFLLRSPILFSVFINAAMFFGFVGCAFFVAASIAQLRAAKQCLRSAQKVLAQLIRDVQHARTLD